MEQTMDIKTVSGGIFEVGELTHPYFRKYYSGDCYEKVLAGYEQLTGCTAANVTFAPGCRNEWHSHPGGQLLLVISGKGWYQEEGKKARGLRAGDVVQVGPNVKHWHGAAKDSWYVHLAVKEVASVGMPTWFGMISEEEYLSLEASV